MNERETATMQKIIDSIDTTDKTVGEVCMEVSNNVPEKDIREMINFCLKYSEAFLTIASHLDKTIRRN